MPYLRFLLQPPITLKFKEKLSQNFHTLTPGEMVLYFLFFRPFWSKERRFFFEGSLGLMGQMYVAERKAIYELMLTHKPRQCFEIGTFTGGGSTFFISAAFSTLNHGTLITMENNNHYYQKAVGYFSKHLPKLNQHIHFIFNDSTSAFDDLISFQTGVDAVFFDGAEDDSQTLSQYHYFEPHFKSGSVIMFHDWETKKTAAIRPIIENDPQWEPLVVLTPPISVGFAAFKRK